MKGWFIYPAWRLAAGGVACLFASYRRRERAWRWTVVVLLVLFLLLGLAPSTGNHVQLHTGYE